MKYIDLLRAKLAEFDEQRSGALVEMDTILSTLATEERAIPSAEEDALLSGLKATIDGIDANEERQALEARLGELEALEATRTTTARRAPVTGASHGDPRDVDVHRIGDGEARARARTMIEQSHRFVADEHRETLTKLIDRQSRTGAAAARMALVTSTDDYFSGWSKYMTGNHFAMTEAERSALAKGADVLTPEERSMTSGTGNSGGYLVPVFIDPTMVITGAGSISPLRQLATVKTIGPAFGGWYGATAAQVTAAWTAEGNAAPDNTPTVGQPNIPVHMAEAFVDVSFQGFEDISDLAGDVLALFTDAKANLEATAHQTGAGGTLPKGVMAAVAAVSGSRVASAAAATYALADVFSVHAALPARFRNPGSRRAWLASMTIIDKTRQLVMAQNSANSLWTDIRGGVPASLLGDDVFEGSALSTSTATGQDVLLYGDFSRYYIIDRIGFTTEFIPNLFDTTTGRPVAKRGWLSHWRTGADVVDANAFRDLRIA